MSIELVSDKKVQDEIKDLASSINELLVEKQVPATNVINALLLLACIGAEHLEIPVDDLIIVLRTNYHRADGMINGVVH